MKKNFKNILLGIIVIAISGLVTSCTQIAPNSVFSVDDLPGKTIGVQLGTTGDIYASDFEEEGSVLERYNKGADAVQALKQGKIDVVIIDVEPAKAFVAKNSDLKILDDPFEIEEYAMCIAKTNSELKEKINAAIGKLKQDGTLASIISNYIGDDTKGKTPYISNNTDYSNGTLTMATNAEFEPYEFKQGGKITGIDVDLTQAIADMLKMKLVIENMDFDSIIAAVQSGKADIGVAGMSVTESRLISVDFTDSYTTATQVMIVRGK